jgi:hypothetical protein
MLQVLPKYCTPGRLSHKIKSFALKTQKFWGLQQAGCGDVTSLYKNLVKNRKTNFPRQAIQEPIFFCISVANANFEGGGD